MADNDLSEDDVSVKFITPAIVQAGWDEATQIRRQVFFTKGRIIVRGRLVSRGKAKKADFVLYWQHIPIALIEAKKASFPAGHGMQQALDYASALQVPFVFASNGGGFVFHDRTGLIVAGEADLAMHEFPGPDLLWAKYREWKGLGAEQEKIVLEPYFDDSSGRQPRHYQRNAIDAAVEAIAKGRDRVLLVMATGTGKTYTAFQIIWRLWKSSWHAGQLEEATGRSQASSPPSGGLAQSDRFGGRQKRVLYLADRNILVDQTMVNDFRPFGARMAKLSTQAKTIERDDCAKTEITLALDRHRRIDTSFEIYEQLLNDLQSAGNAGEYYTPRALTAFMVDRIDPRPGETLFDPSCGTGGFLTCAIRHMRDRYVKRPDDEARLQAGLRAVEKKRWTTLGTLVAHSDSGWSPKTLDHPRAGDEWGVLKVSAVSWGTFRAWENKQVLPGTEPRLQALVRRGDFLISRANTAELIARAVIVEDEPRHLMMSDKIVRLSLSASCSHRYVWLVNNFADFAREHYTRHASGVSPSMKNVTRESILRLPLPFPPLAEQRRIVTKVDELMALCDHLEASLNQGDDHRRRLLEALLHESLEPVTALDEAA